MFLRSSILSGSHRRNHPIDPINSATQSLIKQTDNSALDMLGDADQGQLRHFEYRQEGNDHLLFP
jgi:hypothetical protein